MQAIKQVDNKLNEQIKYLTQVSTGEYEKLFERKHHVQFCSTRMLTFRPSSRGKFVSESEGLADGLAQAGARQEQGV